MYTRICELIEAVVNSSSEQAISELANFLDSVSNSIISEVDTEESGKTAFETLEKIHQLVWLPSLNQEVIDTLAFELPKVVAKLGCVSQRCSEVTKNIIDRFVGRCSPRDMLSIFCEALGSPSELFVIPSYFVPLLVGLAKVLVLIQRRHFEQVNAAVPVVLNILKTFSSTSDYEDTDYGELFRAATDVACSIHTICVKLEGDNFKLHAILGLYVLQLMALVSIGMRSEISRCILLVVQLSEILHSCKLSYSGLITGCEVAKISKLVIVDDGDDGISCFSHVKLGASLAVIWGYKNSEVAMSAKADLTAVKQNLQDHWNSRFEVIGMLKFIFTYADLPLELKTHAIEFLLFIMDGIAPHSYDDHLDYTTYMPAFYVNLQAIEMVIMNAPDTMSRRNAFAAFKKVLSDIPTSVRFDVLRALIKSAGSSSMVAILLDCVKEEMHVGKTTDRNSYISFWSPSVLELVEMVLRPLKGGPPSLPEYSDAVLSALNFYRFILITESTGKSNYTGILSKDILQKAYNEWFLPLRTLVSFMEAETQRNWDHELVSDAVCALNPVELVLYRCIELVEEELKHL
ncbi:aberrant root formation protein 4 isoform X2 [Primulina huaijiensis]|uniref:aberrant root formation protein 4 isoform X2 n=1 Tax=Primulina huaijiensis TaxID=1492673 RepID=UPI003CC736F9